MEHKRIYLCLTVLLNLVNSIFEFLSVTHLSKEEGNEQKVEVILHTLVQFCSPVPHLNEYEFVAVWRNVGELFVNHFCEVH